MNRRRFLGGLAGILAASVAPALITSRGVRGMTKAADSGLWLPVNDLEGREMARVLVAYPNMVVTGIDHVFGPNGLDVVRSTVRFAQQGLRVGYLAQGTIEMEGASPFVLGQSYTIEEERYGKEEPSDIYQEESEGGREGKHLIGFLKRQRPLVLGKEVGILDTFDWRGEVDWPKT
jgi:hypothetical protein